MRVLVVSHAFPPNGVGGTERYADFTARGLQSRGHDVRVFAGTLEWREAVEVEEKVADGLPVVEVHRSDLYFDHWDKLFNPHVSSLFAEEVERWRPDAVHLHHWVRLSADLVRRAAAAGVPSVVHLHDLLVTCPRVFRIDRAERCCDEPLAGEACVPCAPRWKFQKDAEVRASLAEFQAQTRADVAAAALRLAPSRSHADLLERFAGLGAGSVEVFPHPRMPGGPEGGGSGSHSPEGQLSLVYFSHLHPVKGAHVLLEAVKLLGTSSGVRVHLHGGFATPDYEERIRGLAEGLDVEFHGPYSPGNVSGFEGDAVVIPTLARESWSFWLDEAVTLRVPILASRSGALEERSSDRVVLFEPGDAADLAGKITALRDDRDARLRRGAAPAGELDTPDEHLSLLEAKLAEAVERGAPAVSPLPRPEDLAFEWDRREAGFQELLRSEGWEDVVADLERRLAPRNAPDE